MRPGNRRTEVITTTPIVLYSGRLILDNAHVAHRVGGQGLFLPPVGDLDLEVGEQDGRKAILHPSGHRFVIDG